MYVFVLFVCLFVVVVVFFIFNGGGGGQECLMVCYFVKIFYGVSGVKLTLFIEINEY